MKDISNGCRFLAGLVLGLSTLIPTGCGRTGIGGEPMASQPVAVCDDDQDCDDSLVCSGLERCVAGRCIAGRPPACDDADPCTDDVCLEPLGCRGIPATERCLDAGEEATSSDAAMSADAVDSGYRDTGYAQRIPDYCEGSIVTNDVIATENTTLEALQGIACIDGDLAIVGAFIETLEPLASLRWLGGALAISGTPSLHSLDGLDALENVDGSVAISGLPGAPAMSPLRHLVTVKGDLSLQDIGRLRVLAGFDALLRVSGSLFVRDVPRLTEMSASFSVLAHVGLTLSLQKLPEVRALHGFNRLTHLGGELKLPAALQELEAFAALEELSRGLSVPASLETLRGFDALRRAAGLSIDTESVTLIDAFHALEEVDSGLTIAIASDAKVSAFERLTRVGRLTLSTGISRTTHPAVFAALEVAESITLTGTELVGLPFPSLRAAPEINLLGNPELLDLSALDGLQSIDALTVRHNNRLKRLPRTPMVAEIGSLAVRGNPVLEELGFVGLQRITESLVVAANPLLSRCQADVFSQMLTPSEDSELLTCCNGGCLECEARGCTQAGDFRAGQSTDLDILDYEPSVNLDAYAHVETAGRFTVLGPVGGSQASLAHLTQVGALTLGSVAWTDLRIFAAIESLSYLDINASSIESLDGLENLHTVESAVFIRNCPNLVDISLPSLTHVDGSFNVEWCPALSTCQAEALDAQLSSEEATFSIMSSGLAGCRSQCIDGVCQ